MQFSRDGAVALCAPVLFDLRTGEPRQFRPPSPWEWNRYGAALAPDRRRVLFGLSQTFVGASPLATLCLWDSVTNQMQMDFPTFPGQMPEVAISPDGSHALSGGGAVQLWDIDRRSLLGTMTGDKWALGRQVAFSPDGRWSVSSWDRAARLWDFDSDRTLSLKGHSDTVSCVAFSHGGGRIATGSYDGTVRLWAAG
jgi:WD40 repeat protein